MEWPIEFAYYHHLPRVSCDGCDFACRVGGAGSICGMHRDLATLAHNLAIGGALEYEHECAIQEERAMNRGTLPPMCLCGHQADRWGRAKCPACWGSP